LIGNELAIRLQVQKESVGKAMNMKLAMEKKLHLKERSTNERKAREII
jgi:plasmid maintenance system antidote protein VapI